MKNVRKGSVMMELVVVLPIYLVLFGGVFMLGDMLIRSIRLPSAEHTRAFDLGRTDGKVPGWDVVEKTLFRPDREVSDNGQATDLLTREKESAYYVDREIEGPFSVRTATNVRNDYALLAGGSRGQMAFAYRLFQGRLEHDPVDEVEKDVPNLYQPGGRMKMHSKPETKTGGSPREYTYNYYTLKRHRYNWGSEVTWRDNRRYAHELLIKSSNKGGLRAWEAVADETFHQDVGDEPSSAKKMPANRPDDGLVQYKRYERFVTWSE